MTIGVDTINSTRVMNRYGLDSSQNAVQALFNLQIPQQKTPSVQQITRSGDILDISPQAKALFDAVQKGTDNIAWEQSRTKTYDPESNQMIWELSRKETVQSGDKTIAWEQTRRKIMTLSDETVTTEQTQRKTVNSGNDSIIWEQTQRKSPQSDLAEYIWQQTRRKTVQLGKEKVDLEQSKKEIFNPDEQQSSKNKKALKSGKEDDTQSQNSSYVYPQAATAYVYGVSAETAYQMNMSGISGQQQVINYFA